MICTTEYGLMPRCYLNTLLSCCRGLYPGEEIQKCQEAWKTRRDKPRYTTSKHVRRAHVPPLPCHPFLLLCPPPSRPAGPFGRRRAGPLNTRRVCSFALEAEAKMGKEMLWWKGERRGRGGGESKALQISQASLFYLFPRLTFAQI